MNVIWDEEAEHELYSFAAKNSSAASAIGDIFKMFSEFGRSGVPQYGVACPLANTTKVCYWPDTSLKGFFCFDDETLYVAHVAETNNGYELDAALILAEKRYLEFQDN